MLALAGCSDDGLAPPADTEASTSGTGVVSGASSEGGLTLDAGQTADPGTGAGTTAVGDSGTGDVGTSDTGGSDSTTGEAPPPMACEMDMDCVLVDDCCECAAHHVDDVLQECPTECDQTMCAALGISDIGVVCADTTCELEKRDCSGVVACDSLPPDCAEGTLPEVGPGGGGGCWTGACIPIEACDPLPSCDYCDETQACVATETQQGIVYSCQALPEACMGTATCECMPDACESPFDTCADADGQLTCSCPAC